MRQRPAAFVAEDIGKLLEPNLDRFGGVDVLGQVGGFAPDGLKEGGHGRVSMAGATMVTQVCAVGLSIAADTELTHQQSGILLLEAMKTLGRILCLFLTGAPGGERA